MIGAVRGVDARSGHYFDDTKHYVDALTNLSESERTKIYEGNARRAYPRLNKVLAAAAR
jgi:4-oxalmesaconate hydratase